MKPVPPLKKVVKVSELLKDRLKETKHTAAELAEAAEVPEVYIEQLIAGRRRPPLPSRTDVYEKMTRFLRLGRNDLVLCASAERTGKAEKVTELGEDVKRIMLALCDPETARSLERRARKDEAELFDLLTRVLQVVQGSARRTLDDGITLRLQAAQRGSSYPEMRMRVLDFLDATPCTVTIEDLNHFLRPRVERWDVDMQTGVLKVTLAAHEAPDQNRRRPQTRTGRMRLAG